MKFYTNGSPILGATPVAAYGTPCCGYGAIEEATFQQGAEVQAPAPPAEEKGFPWGAVAGFTLLFLGVGAGIYVVTR